MNMGKRILSLLLTLAMVGGMFVLPATATEASITTDSAALEGSTVSSWQNFYDKESGICDFYLSIFEEEDGQYFRCDEHQQEKCYSLETLKKLLLECGFEFLEVVSDFDFSTPTEATERYYIVARAKK